MNSTGRKKAIIGTVSCAGRAPAFCSARDILHYKPFGNEFLVLCDAVANRFRIEVIRIIWHEIVKQE